MFRKSLVALLLFAQVVALAGCDEISGIAGAEQRGETLSVPLQVIDRQGSVLALVPVYIEDQGPFAFALDTGASQSLIDRELAEQLGLPETGEVSDVVGISGAAEATGVRVERWRAGEVQLPATTAIVLDLPDPNRGEGLRGLLGEL